MPEFVLKLDKANMESLGSVRCIDGLQAVEDGQYIWLRGISSLLDMDIALKQLPLKNTFIIDEQNNLFLPGGLTPVDKFGKLEWQPLMEFFKVELPTAAFPGKSDEVSPIKLIKSSKEREGKALLTSLKAWKQYAETAPLSRLHSIKFAVSEKAEVLIVGYPLPPLPGGEYWEKDDILIPAGYEFEFSLMTSFINKRINENKSSLILIDPAGGWQKIDKNFFVIGKRSAVRLTKSCND